METIFEMHILIMLILKIFDGIFPINDKNRNIDTTKTIDLWYISTFSPFREIIELKNPNTDIFCLDKDRNILYFSPESSKAISQLDIYITLANFNVYKGLENNEEIILKNTNGVIFIGKNIMNELRNMMIRFDL